MVEEEHVQLQCEDCAPEYHHDGLACKRDFEACAAGQLKVVGTGGHDEIAQLLDHDVGDLMSEEYLEPEDLEDDSFDVDEDVEDGVGQQEEAELEEHESEEHAV